uniref:Transposon Ty3-G Gag-Pol polyprotein n=1 Tax=Tanacetum cinerariifolium TaxID=118510 RepID=A0A6L2MH88_TANCI|nr:transposon Ty3-G Gag-Pol polyprotein [Tanacetum cinerariifolium]
MGDYHNLQITVHTIQQKNPGHHFSSGGGPDTGHGNNHKPYLKLHFPRFSGDDPTAWLYQAEQYFDFQKVPDNDQAHLASLHLEGIAFQWHRWFTKSRGPLTWAEFSTALLRRFGPTDFEDPSETLSRLTQASTVATYIEAFERLSHRVDGLPEVFLLGCFIGGLKDEIRLEVKIKKPRNLSDVISITRLVENKLTLNRTPSSLPRNVGSTAPPKPSTSAGLLGPGPSTRLALPAPPPIRRFSNQEAREHREKGFCYYCDERYVPGHKCRQIKKKDVVVLVNNGSTLNFIDQALVDRFGLTVEKDTPFKVMVANREHVSCAGRWLKNQGPVETDYEKLTLGFHLAGSSHKLQGLKSSELAALKSHEAMVMHGLALLLHVSLLPLEPTSDISPCTAIRDVLERFAKEFQEPVSLPPYRSQDHSIPLILGARPVSTRPYRQRYLQKTEIERQVRELLQQGLIRPSHDPFSSLVLLVKKADGSWHFCIDYRSLNDITVKDNYPISVIEELHGSRINSKLDLRSGYHQIRVQDEESNHIFAKQSKCCFRVSQVHCLGHLISVDGVAVEPNKVQSVLSWPTPKNAKGVRGFLGLASYYRKFIQGFGSIATPLHKLVGKGPFVWDEVAEAAIQTLKIALTTTPTLGLPDWSQPFTVERDAGGVGVGAVLTQCGKPLAYFSALLKGLMLSWSTYEKEMLAVVKAVRKWQHYLLGYDYTIEYKKGVFNRGADALSRIPQFHFIAISHPCASIWQDIQNEVRTDPYYQTLLTDSDHGGRHELVMRDGIWFRDGAILLCPTSPLLETVLALCHTSPEGGHFGFHKTLHKVKQTFWWKGLKQRVKFFIKECQVCQRFKSDSMLPAGLLQPLPISERVWEDISMDFVEGLPNSKGFTVVIVVVDRLSKYAHFIPLKHPFTAVSVAKEFVLNVVKLHGIPATVVSDRDKVFISSFWQALFKLQCSHLCMSSSYHPQTDGQTEVINRIMEQYLRCFAGDQPKKWLDWLPWAEYSYNTSVHSSTKLSPFQVVYGRPPPRLVPYVPGTTKVQAIDEYLGDRDTLLRQLRANLIVAQNRMKVQADRKRREVEFLEGDLVFVKLQPYRQVTVAHRTSHKLAPKFFEPYKILKRVGHVAYQLQLPPGSLIHDVFHVSLLRKCEGHVVPTAPVVLDDTVFTPLMPQPECVLDERVIKKGKY